MISYSLQSVMMVRVYREMDGLSATAYRGLTFLITMSPLLLFAEHLDITKIIPFLPPLLLASFVTVFANAFIATAYANLPVGIASALGMSVGAIVVACIAYVAFDEVLSWSQILVILLLLTGIGFLAISRSTVKIVHQYRPLIGMSAAVAFGFSIATGNALLAVGARGLDPMISAFVWEFGVGVIALLLALLRGVFTEKGLAPTSLKKFTCILLYASPTVLGTGCITIAMSLGPLAILSAILTSIAISSTLLAWFFYGERLSAKQWGLLLYCCAMVAVLKVFSG